MSHTPPSYFYTVRLCMTIITFILCRSRLRRKRQFPFLMACWLQRLEVGISSFRSNQDQTLILAPCFSLTVFGFLVLSAGRNWVTCSSSSCASSVSGSFIYCLHYCSLFDWSDWSRKGRRKKGKGKRKRKEKKASGKRMLCFIFYYY